MYRLIYNVNTSKVASITKVLPDDPLPKLSKKDFDNGWRVHVTNNSKVSFRTHNFTLSEDGEELFSQDIPARSIIKPVIIPRDVDQIVFVRTHKSIGDLVSITSAIQAARKQRLNAKIAVKAPLPARSILENHPGIDQLLDLDANVDGKIIDLSHPCPCGEYETAMRDEIDRSRNEIFTLASGFHWEKERPRLYLSEAEKKFGLEFTNCNTNKTKIGVCLRTAETWKDWPFVEDFIALLNESNYEVYAFDKSIQVENAINVTGKSIREVMSILVYMDCVISPDTAIFHLCDALDVSCIALFGSMRADLHANKYPSCISYLQGKCQYDKSPCMYDICEGKGQFQKCMQFDPKLIFEKMKQKLFTGTVTD